MARAPLSDAATPPEHELRAFARLAAPFLAADAPRPGGRLSLRGRRGAGHEFLEHRGYRPGDDLRWVNWLLSARFGTPIVREFRAESSRDWLLCIDASSSMAVAGGVKWRHATRLAAAFAYLLLDAGHGVGVVAFAETTLRVVPPGRGRGQYLRIARLLAATSPAPAGHAAHLGTCLAHLAGCRGAVLCSDFLAPAGFEAELARCAARCEDLHLLGVTARAERRLPPGPAFELRDVETGERRVLARDASTERRADAAAEERAARLGAYCRTAGISFSVADCERAWQPTLLAHLARGGRA